MIKHLRSNGHRLPAPVCNAVGWAELTAERDQVTCRRCLHHLAQNPAPGDRFGARVVISETQRKRRYGHRRVKWRCDCGREGATDVRSLVASLACASCSQGRSKTGASRRPPRQVTCSRCGQFGHMRNSSRCEGKTSAEACERTRNGVQCTRAIWHDGHCSFGGTDGLGE